jgi:hypothetical protein
MPRKGLRIIGHPKFIGKNLPLVHEHYDVTIESTFKKPKRATDKGDATRAMVERARRKMVEGMTAKEATADTVAFMKRRANMSKLYKDLYKTIYYAVRKDNRGPKPTGRNRKQFRF